MTNFAFVFRLALREFLYSWQHFKIFIACLLIGISVMATINSLGTMIRYAFEQEAQILLGGDVEIGINGQTATTEQLAYFKNLGKVSKVSTMRAMLQSQSETTLVALKAVDDPYPLVGVLSLEQSITKDQALKDRGIIVDKSLLAQLNLSVGSKVKIGKTFFTIKAVLQTEPDRAIQVFSFGPRVMLSEDSLMATGLVSPLSLIRHRYRILLPEAIKDPQAFEKRLEAQLAEDFPKIAWRIVTSKDSNARAERFVSQLLAFLNLSALATLLIAGIGIASSVRIYLGRKMNGIAIIKVLGGARSQIITVYTITIALLAMVSSILGVILTVTCLKLAIPFLAGLIPSITEHSQLHLKPLVLAVWNGFLMTYIFSLPALLNVLDTRPSALFRSKASVLQIKMTDTILFLLAFLLLLLIATLIFTADDKPFVLSILAGFSVTFGVFYVCASLVRRVAKQIRTSKPWLRLALGNLYRPGNSAGTVIYAVGISLTVLLVLLLTEANFQYRIQEIVEEDAPTLFMFGIQPTQRDGLAAILKPYATAGTIWQWPMIRGRITHRNDLPISEEDVDSKVRWAIRGERGLSYSKVPPPHTTFQQGRWWSEDYTGEPLLSIDARFIEGMDLKLGDTLTFNILGEAVKAKIVNARDIDYTTFQINFSMILSPGVLEQFPHTYLTTVHLKDADKDEAHLVRTITKTYPNITIIRTTEVVEVVKSLLEKIALALRVIVAIGLLTGVLVMISALAATLEQRQYDIAVLKILGARRADILKSCFMEWGILSISTSIIASLIGTISAYFILVKLRSYDFNIMPHVTLLTSLGCFVLVSLTGFVGNKRLFHLKPAGLLRNE